MAPVTLIVGKQERLDRRQGSHSDLLLQSLWFIFHEIYVKQTEGF